jgi:FtsP/CotA-like multicopper oxidase with cupredoxin domain
MLRVNLRHAVALAVVLTASAAAANDPAAPGPRAYDPHSTSAAPCGIGVPPPGHVAADLHPTREGMTLTVKQDGSRLCYVSAGIADAPVIRVRQGDDLTITLRNDIDDPAAIEAVTAPGAIKTPNTAVPREAGYYPVIPGIHHQATGATNLHVHGFAVPPVVPQDEVLMTCTDPAVGPANCGQRAFTYRYHVPADMPEGLYWYHPHMHGEVQAQMLMGLSGAIVVEGPEDDARRAAGIGERVLIVRQTQDLDAGKAAGASITAAGPATAKPPAGAAVPATAIDTAHELLCAPNSGIDQISFNGTPVPSFGDGSDSALATLEIPAGTTQLWRLLNAATDAFLDLALVDESGKSLPVEIVARDGAPLIDDSGRRLNPPPTTEPQLVPPAGRLEFMVAPPPPGVKAYLLTRSVLTGCAGDQLPERRLAVVTASPATSKQSSKTVTATAESVVSPDAFSGLMSRKTDHTRIVALAEYPRPGTADATDFYIVERRPNAVLKPFAMDDPPMITVSAGTTEEWTIENWTNELHAFHIHQLHFRVLAIDGKPLADPPLLDTVTVPFATATGYRDRQEGPVRPGRVVIKLYFPPALAGDIPIHCHLVDHEDNGMMGIVRVLPDAASPIQKSDRSIDDLIRASICRAPRPANRQEAREGPTREVSPLGITAPAL